MKQPRLPRGRAPRRKANTGAAAHNPDVRSEAMVRKTRKPDHCANCDVPTDPSRMCQLCGLLHCAKCAQAHACDPDPATIDPFMS